jgi:replicative DNA helicase
MIAQRQAELNAFATRHFARGDSRGRTSGRGHDPGSALTDEAVLARCREAKNAGKFLALWAGSTADHGGDDSAADLALLSLLAFWTQDPDQLDRLFRRSGLCRAKWTERADYRERTIAKALDRDEVWTPSPGLVPHHRGGEGSSTVAGSAEEDAAEPIPAWEEPAPVADSPRPPFPTALLPDPLRAFVEALALATQTPPALAALLCLAVLAAAAAKRVAVRVREGWIEPVNIFVVGALRPGERKSAVFAETTAPLEGWEAAEATRLAPEIAAAETTAKIAEDTLLKVRKAAAGEDDPVRRADLTAQATALAQEIATAILPERPRLLVDDCSPERLASLMSRHGGRIAAMSAEGGLFEIMAGRYAKDSAPNLDVFLKSHAGDTVRVDRVGRPPDFVRASALTVALTVQPDVVHGLARKPQFRGRGLLARFWYALPTSLVGHRRINPPPVPDDVRVAYTALVEHVLGLRPLTAADGSPAPRLLELSPAAADLHEAFETAIEPQLGEFGELAHVADWGGKLAGATARLAGLLHLAAHAADDAPWEIPIAGGTMEAAVTIARDFLTPHALAAFAEMGADPALADARLVLRWLGRTERTVVSRRDLLAGLPKRFREGDHLNAALRLLVVSGYLREREPLDRRGQPGRPASPVFDVNPRWCPQNPRNPQNGGGEPGFVNSGDCVDASDTAGEGLSARRGDAAAEDWEIWNDPGEDATQPVPEAWNEVQRPDPGDVSRNHVITHEPDPDSTEGWDHWEEPL